VPPEAGAHTPVMAGVIMAGTALLISGPVGYLLRYVGRVKLLLPVAVVATSLVLTLLLLDETRSRVSETYFVIGCVLSVCDSCFQVCFIGGFHSNDNVSACNISVFKHKLEFVDFTPFVRVEFA